MSHVNSSMQWQLVRCIVVAARLITSAPAPERVPMGTLSGKVVGPNGRPVTMARVWIETIDAKTSSTKVLAEARTDAGGSFRLGPVEAVYRGLGAGGLRVEAEGFATQCIPSGRLSIFPSLDCDIGTIRLDYGRVFTGRVIDFDNKPAAGAIVTSRSYWLQAGHGLGGVVSDKGVTTDANGQFRTPPLPVGHLGLAIRVPERQPASVNPGLPIRPGGEEDLGTIRLKKDVPVMVVVRDEDGRPVSGASVSHGGTTDADGRTMIRGHEANFSLPMKVFADGYAPLAGSITVTNGGATYNIRRGIDLQDKKPAKILNVILRRAGWIEGKAIDADTSEAVHLDNVVVCNFQRKPNGEVVLRGCRSDFEQSHPGRFRASFPTPNEYHLTFTAAGYHDAEAYTPKVTELKTVGGIVVRMKKKANGSTPTIVPQSISGKVSRDGRAVESGWVGLWALSKPNNAVNGPVLRGRTVVGDPIVYASAAIRDGSYRLEVPFQSDAWYVVVEEPGHALTQIGPLSIALKEQKILNIACVRGGRIRGRVKDLLAGWDGHLWVVAFTKTAVQAEARVEPDGQFTLPPLPPGEYGLKAGYDAFDDAEVYPGNLALDHPQSFKEIADPWKRAKIATVELGRDPARAEVEFPR